MLVVSEETCKNKHAVHAPEYLCFALQDCKLNKKTHAQARRFLQQQQRSLVVLPCDLTALDCNQTTVGFLSHRRDATKVTVSCVQRTQNVITTAK